MGHVHGSRAPSEWQQIQFTENLTSIYNKLRQVDEAFSNTDRRVSYVLNYTSVHIALVATTYQVYNQLKEILGYNSQSVGRVIMHSENYL